MGSIKGSSRSAGLHARNSWTCVCGRTVHGNGGKSSHQRACRPWTERLIERNQKLITQIDTGTYSRRMSAKMQAGLRAQAESAITRLRARLAESQ